MARGKYLSLEEARKAGQIDRFCKEHPSNAEGDRFERLLDAMCHGEPPRSSKAAGRTSSQAGGGDCIETRIRRDT